MKKIITLITFVFILQSCENKTQKVTENKPLQQTVDKDGTHPSEYEDVKIDNHSNDKTILGEDAQEINCYVKNIYEKNIMIKPYTTKINGVVTFGKGQALGNTLVMIEYRDKNNDGKEDKILNYYERK